MKNFYFRDKFFHGGIFNRCVQFAKSSFGYIEHSVIGMFGASIDIGITRDADLLQRIYVEITLPQLPPNYEWVDDVQYAIIRSATLNIGGVNIMKVTNHLIYMNRSANRFDSTIVIDLPFYFTKQGSSVPLIALPYHNVKLNIELEDINQLLKFNNLMQNQHIPMKIIWKGIYVHEEERRRIATYMNECLISTVLSQDEQLIVPEYNNVQYARDAIEQLKRRFSKDIVNRIAPFIQTDCIVDCAIEPILRHPCKNLSIVYMIKNKQNKTKYFNYIDILKGMSVVYGVDAKKVEKMPKYAIEYNDDNTELIQRCYQNIVMIKHNNIYRIDFEHTDHKTNTSIQPTGTFNLSCVKWLKLKQTIDMDMYCKVVDMGEYIFAHFINDCFNVSVARGGFHLLRFI